VAGARVWLLLAYKVPREPSSGRVYVWRKLKKLGAVALQDAVWVLPSTPQTLEQFRWLAAEIDEMDGEASLWESRHLLDGRDEQLVRQFEAQVEEPYGQILVALKGLKGRKSDPSASPGQALASLSRQYRQTLAQDYFRCPLGRKVHAALLAARGDRGGPAE
jgi:hypothetical protein